MLAPVIEDQSRTGHEVPHRSAHQHFARVGPRCDPCRDVDGDARHVGPASVDLAGVKADPQIDAERPGAADECLAAPPGARRPVERGERTVAGRLHDRAAGRAYLGLDETVLPVEQITPGPVAKARDQRRRADHVGEHNGGQYTIELRLGRSAGQEHLDAIERVGVVLARAGQRDVEVAW